MEWIIGGLHWRSAPAFQPNPTYEAGLAEGYHDARSREPYRDLTNVAHTFIVLVPGAGSTPYSAGYREGWLKAIQAEAGSSSGE